jgi:hypothetical protein
MILARMSAEDSRLIEQHPLIFIAVVVVLFVLGWMAKR